MKARLAVYALLVTSIFLTGIVVWQANLIELQRVNIAWLLTQLH
jgi:hypothetical protein